MTGSVREKGMILLKDDGNDKKFNHGTQVTKFGAEFRIDSGIKDVSLLHDQICRYQY